VELPGKDTLDYMAILRGIARRHKRLVAAIFFVLAIPLITLVFFTSRTSYLSAATIVIESSPLDQTPLFKDLTRKDNVATYLVLLKSRSFTEAVVEALPKESFEELITESQYTDYMLVLTNLVKGWLGKPLTVLSPQQRAISELRNARMEFLRSPETPDILNIMGTASKPRVAMDLVNTHIQVLLSRTRTSNQEEARRAREFLEQQVQQIKESLTQAEGALTKFQQQRGRVGLGSQTEFDLMKLSQVESALAEAQASREVLTSHITRLRQAIDTGSAMAPPSSVLQEYQNRLNAFKAAQDNLARLEGKLASMRERYTELHPLVQSTQEQVTNEQIRVAQLARELPVAPSVKESPGAQANLLSPLERADPQRQLATLLAEDATLQEKAETLKDQVDRLRNKLRNLSQDELEFSNLRRTLESNRNLSTLLSDKLMAARIREQGEAGFVRIIDPASFPMQPTQSRTQKRLLMILGLAAGLAFAVAFAIEFWRLPVETESDVLKATGLPVLGSVGVFDGPTAGRKGTQKKTKRSPLPVLLPNSSDSVVIHMELYRAMRAAIEMERLKAPFRSVLVTSPGPGEGKSTTVLNLAHAFREFGRRVLVVDTDLRRPSIHRALSLSNRPGVVDFLRGTATFEQVCRPLPSGVIVIPAQVAPEDAASLLASSRVMELLALANDRFDLILVDSAPILAVPDNLLLLTVLDRAILVLKATATSKRDLQKALKALDQMLDKILGVILNQANARDVHYYRHRYSKYYPSSDGKGAQESPKKSRLLA
jgi:succinoglycan biosynthesis transport protein ExoP